MTKPTRPRDAASLVITRRGRGAIRVLMGRRPPRDRFMPDVWVFPGGRVEQSDAGHDVLRALPRGEARRLEARWPARRVRALATAAIRETWEETGLALGEVRGGSLLPDHGRLKYLGRAITPAESAIRYHARFFMADSTGITGRLRGNGELIDLAWIPIGKALELPIIDVTQAMLEQVARLDAGTRTAGRPFIHYYRGQQRIDREA